MIVYTDGSAHPNPGPGGYGVVGIENGRVVYAYSKQCPHTTNNEMELKAILYALIKFGKQKEPVEVYTDSAYAYNTYTSWMHNWARSNWRKSDKKTPENLSVIQAYYSLVNKNYKINLNLIKGHNGTFGNEVADALATGSCTAEQVIDKGELND